MAVYEGVRDVMGVKEDPPDPFSDDIQEMNENYVSIYNSINPFVSFTCSAFQNNSDISFQMAYERV